MLMVSILDISIQIYEKTTHLHRQVEKYKLKYKKHYGKKILVNF